MALGPLPCGCGGLSFLPFSLPVPAPHTSHVGHLGVPTAWSRSSSQHCPLRDLPSTSSTSRNSASTTPCRLNHTRGLNLNCECLRSTSGKPTRKPRQPRRSLGRWSRQQECHRVTTRCPASGTVQPQGPGFPRPGEKSVPKLF